MSIYNIGFYEGLTKNIFQFISSYTYMQFFYEDLTKIIFQLSLYSHLISSSENNHMESNRECHNKK